MAKKKSKRSVHHHAENVFDDPTSKFFAPINDVLAIATVVSVFAIILETMAWATPHHHTFKVVEYIVTILFTAEYIGRVIVTKKKFGYIFSFFGILDLLAIIPTYLGLGNLTFLKTARTLRIVRLLRMVRLAKLAKVKRKKDGASSLYALNIQIYAITLLTSLLVLGTLFFIFEGHNANAKDIPAGMYWAFKAILGGLPYPQPETIGGTLTLIGARFVSMILLGMMLSLIGTMVRKLLIGSEKDA